MSKFTMNNINTQPHEVVATENAFLFTKQHLKTEFPKYFVDEDSTYFFERNGLLKVLHVFGDQCVPYENIDEQSLYRLTREHDWIHRLWTPPPPPEGASSLQPVLHHAVVVSAQIFDS